MAWLHADIGAAGHGLLAPKEMIRMQRAQESDQVQPADHLPGGQALKQQQVELSCWALPS